MQPPPKSTSSESTPPPDLADLLAAAGSRFDPVEVAELIRGVMAAPAARDPEAWMRLVAPEPPPELRAGLAAYRATLEGIAAPPPPTPAERLAALRAELAARGLDGFVVPHGDEHQGEYVPPRADRLTWLTGFTGSAGAAVVLAEDAAIFVDGRYTLQVRQQVDPALYAPHHLVEEPPSKWPAGQVAEGQRIGYDPWLHSTQAAETLARALEAKGATLVPCDDNPVDAIWAQQPPPPLAPIVAHDIAYAGRASADKRTELADALGADGVAAAVLTQPDAIAWLLNVRGGDVPCTPLPLSFALLNRDGTVDWFVDDRKLSPGLSEHLGNGVRNAAPEALGPALDALGAAGARVRLDPQTAAAWIAQRLTAAGATLDRGANPVALPKACKNEVELAGTRVAHQRDGVALSGFLAWLEAEAPRGDVTELDAEARLATFRDRDATAELRGSSFATISGAGPNGAIVHYRVTEESNRRLEAGQLYLVDSGAQYLDGTTDVTRTVAVGALDPALAAEARDRFTRVLKGHIAIATARFPAGTTGAQLDTLARQFLWRAGLDYDHGTGHGVGSYLGVHEGPQRISKAGGPVPLKPGMIVSNEPGYYKEGAYGIRIENLVIVIALDDIDGGERGMLGFETLTLAPIDLALVEPSLLTAEEVAWLDAYHARVRREIGPRVDDATRAWLERATRPLGLAAAAE